MSRFLVGLTVILSVWVLSPTPHASAWSWSNLFSWFGGGDGGHDYGRHHYGGHHYGGHGVPELDPGVTGSAMVLLLGGVAYIASRRREDTLR